MHKGKEELKGERLKPILEDLSVIDQTNDLRRWKDSVSYGKRWIVETAISTIKIAQRICLFCQVWKYGK